MNACDLTKQTIERLITKAFEAREMAYNPYSHFAVGAALLTETGTIYKGCNIENAAFGPSNCAERTAIFSAIAQGDRKFRVIAIVGAPDGTEQGQGDFCPPCGVCLQVMSEFCDRDDFEVILAKDVDDYKKYALKELLPVSFQLSIKE